MSDLAKYIEKRPMSFDPHAILGFLDALDKKLIRAELEFDEVKDQVQEHFDFVVSEKVSNNSISVAQAKLQATNDKRYLEIKAEYRKKKAFYLFCKIESKNAHTYCDHLKQQSINELATEKLTRN
mgnify:CR=1 FL=1|tara:strand:+ start:76 stop:450 length:375 start_codon:yes stop_codon:yes gene_type:complete